MTKALIVAWHQYTPFGREFYLPLFELFIKGLEIWGDEFDKLYIIDSKYEFTEEEKEKVWAIKPRTHFVYPRREGHHWIQFKDILPLVAEDALLFLDNDVVIYRKGVLAHWFDQVEKGCDFVGSFDGSGGMRDVIQQKFPFFKHTRMGSYYFILTRKLLDRIDDIDFEPKRFTTPTYIKELDYTTREGDWMDSFGLFTVKMLGLTPPITVFELTDDRSSIFFDGTRNPTQSLNLGYYHMRAGSTPAYLLATREYGDKQTYQDYITHQPQSEYLRQFAWYTYFLHKVSPYHTKVSEKLFEFLRDIHIDGRKWDNYMQEFIDYHGL